jgi:hypothetical protein
MQQKRRGEYDPSKHSARKESDSTYRIWIRRGPEPDRPDHSSHKRSHRNCPEPLSTPYTQPHHYTPPTNQPTNQPNMCVLRIKTQQTRVTAHAIRATYFEARIAPDMRDVREVLLTHIHHLNHEPRTTNNPLSAAAIASGHHHQHQLTYHLIDFTNGDVFHTLVLEHFTDHTAITT